MSKMKKFILTTIFVTLALILSMSTKVSAKTTQKNFLNKYTNGGYFPTLQMDFRPRVAC